MRCIQLLGKYPDHKSAERFRVNLACSTNPGLKWLSQTTEGIIHTVSDVIPNGLIALQHEAMLVVPVYVFQWSRLWFLHEMGLVINRFGLAVILFSLMLMHVNCPLTHGWILQVTIHAKSYYINKLKSIFLLSGYLKEVVPFIWPIFPPCVNGWGNGYWHLE